MKTSELIAALQEHSRPLHDPHVLLWVDGKWCDVTGVGATGEHRNAVMITHAEAPNPVTTISTDGFYVLIVEDDQPSPPWLKKVMNSLEVHTYLVARTDGWKRLKRSAPTDDLPEVFKEILTFPQPTLPAVNITRDKNLIQAEMPQTAAEFLKLVKTHGEPKTPPEKG